MPTRRTALTAPRPPDLVRAQIENDISVYFFAERPAVVGSAAIPSGVTGSSTLYLAPISATKAEDAEEADRASSTVEIQLGIERTGYMLRMKRGIGGRKGRWVRRFFVLTTQGLHRFERSRSGTSLFGSEKEFVPLEEIKSVSEAKRKYGDKCFNMERADKTRAVFTTTDVVERNGWIASIKKLKEEARKQSRRKIQRHNTVAGYVNDHGALDARYAAGARTEDEAEPEDDIFDADGVPILAKRERKRSIYHGAHDVTVPRTPGKRAPSGEAGGAASASASASANAGGSAFGVEGGADASRRVQSMLGMDTPGNALRPPPGHGGMGRDSLDWGSLGSASSPGRPASWGSWARGGNSSATSLAQLANSSDITCVCVGDVVVRRKARWGDTIELGPVAGGAREMRGVVEIHLADGAGPPVVLKIAELEAFMKRGTGWRAGAPVRHALSGARRGCHLELIPRKAAARRGSAEARLGIGVEAAAAAAAVAAAEKISMEDGDEPALASLVLLALPGATFVSLALPIVWETDDYRGKWFALFTGVLLILASVVPIAKLMFSGGSKKKAAAVAKAKAAAARKAVAVYSITPLRVVAGSQLTHRQSGSSDLDFDASSRQRRSMSGQSSSAARVWPHGKMPPAIASPFFAHVPDASFADLAKQLVDARPDAKGLCRAYYLKVRVVRVVRASAPGSRTHARTAY